MMEMYVIYQKNGEKEKIQINGTAVEDHNYRVRSPFTNSGRSSVSVCEVVNRQGLISM